MGRRWWRWCRRGLLVLFGLPAAYVLAALLLALVPLRKDGVAGGEAVYPVYLLSNGVHINLVLPSRNPAADWQTLLPGHDGSEWTYIGWGSHAFYTQVPTWGDLTPPLAARALLWDQSVLYARGGPDPRQAAPELRAEIRLSEAQYRALSADVAQQFASYRPLAGHADFYPAHGAYQPLQTCNEWVRRRLYAVGVPVPVWTPFDRPLLWQLQRSVAAQSSD